MKLILICTIPFFIVSSNIKYVIIKLWIFSILFFISALKELQICEPYFIWNYIKPAVLRTLMIKVIPKAYPSYSKNC